MNSTMRKAAVALVITPMALASLSRGVAKDEVSDETRALFDKDRIELFEFNRARHELFRKAESCYSEGAWDLRRMVPLCDNYYDRLLPRFRKYMVMPNGVPKPLIEALPLITEVADQYKLDPDLLAAIDYKESYGFKYAVHVDTAAAMPEVSLGWGQINIAANRVSDEEYKHIFQERVNLELSAKFLRKCFDRYHSAERAVYAYNHGLYARNTPWRVRHDPYTQTVMRYRELVREDNPSHCEAAPMMRRQASAESPLSDAGQAAGQPQRPSAGTVQMR